MLDASDLIVQSGAGVATRSERGLSIAQSLERRTRCVIARGKRMRQGALDVVDPGQAISHCRHNERKTMKVAASERTIPDVRIFVLPPSIKLLAVCVRVGRKTVQVERDTLLSRDDLLHRCRITSGAIRT